MNTITEIPYSQRKQKIIDITDRLLNNLYNVEYHDHENIRCVVKLLGIELRNNHLDTYICMVNMSGNRLALEIITPDDTGLPMVITYFYHFNTRDIWFGP